MWLVAVICLLGAALLYYCFLWEPKIMTKIEAQYEEPYDRTKATPEEDKARVEEWMMKRRQCPDCNSKEFYGGPEGGLSKNYKCCHCGNTFNVSALHAERI